ncbi:hypothetical protein E8P77_20210 [Soehngenia saccharolytica]|nr:hypothetical protein E8P77_20210 [Soehngenia saccharolytica]
MTTMKTSRHEILKAKWAEIIKDHNSSGLSISQWCKENEISKTKFYYWQRVIREESLIKAGTLAVTGQAQFVEVKPSVETTKLNQEGICAVLRSNGNEIEILNGANPNTLETILKILGRS